MVAAGRIIGEELAMHAAHRLPIFGAGQVDAGADHMLERAAGVGQSLGGDLKDAAGLAGRIQSSAPTGPVPGQMHGVSNAHRAGEADDGLVG